MDNTYIIDSVGIVGGGTMGLDIAALIVRDANPPIPVIVKEIDEATAVKAKERIDGRLLSWYKRGKMDEAKLRRMKNMVQVTHLMQGLRETKLVIEAVPEKLKLKLAIFKELDEIMPGEVIMTSNTSALPIKALAGATRRADRVIGTHFFNPPTKMPLVEIIAAENTSEEVLSTIEEFLQSLKKITIRVKDSPGFLINRLLMPYICEAILAVEEAIVSPEDIDGVVRAFGWPMGPFRLLDFTGIDVAYYAGKFMAEKYSDRMKIPTLLELMIKLNRVGDKTGAGFYLTGADQKPIGEVLREYYPNRRVDMSPQEVFERMMSLFLNEAVRSLEEEIATKDDIETGSLMGIGFPQSKEGPLHWIDEIGADKVLADLKRFEERYGIRFKPCGLLERVAAGSKKFFSSWS